MKNKYSITVWDKINIAFLIITLCSTLFFFITFCLSFVKTCEIQISGTLLGISGICSSLASAFFIAFFIRVIDMKKQRERETKALILLRPSISSIISVISEFFPQMQLLKEISDDNFVVPRGQIFYTDTKIEGHRDFINFSEQFLGAKQKLDKQIEKCINSPVFYQCNLNILNLITKLKINELTQNLKNAAEFQCTNATQKATYFGLRSYYNEFSILFNELCSIVNRKNDCQLQELAPEDRELYIALIKKTKQEVAIPKNTKMYLGNKRIV